MVAEPIPLGMTEEEFVAWCDEDIRAEFVDGEVIIMSPESVVSETVRGFLYKVLSWFVETHELGVVFGPNLQIRPRAGLRRMPDLMFISNERRHLLHAAHFEGAPDLAMEIVSDDSVERDWRTKYHEYAQGGVREYWVIDPPHQRVAVYRLNESGQHEDIPIQDGAFHSTVVNGFWIRPEWLWQEPLPHTAEILRTLGVL